jgi:hypothetical protein
MRTVIALTLLAVSPAFAQATLGVAALGGTVRDQSGALVPAARVALTEESKGLVRRSETDESGSFLFPAVIAGVYSLRVEKDGFNTEQIHALSIEVGQQASIAITLKTGEVRTVMTVRRPSTTELNAESNTIGSLVDSTQVQELPLNGRHFLQLGLLAAGAVDIAPASDLFTANVGPPARTIVLPGTLPSTVVYSLNGMNITGSRDGELAASPSVAAVDQFRVQENFLMPDQGVGPAAVNIVTKSGSNQFHGEAYEFLRNGHLDARSFFAANPEDLKRNQFGIRLGGPLRKDRIWFDAFYEGLRELTAFSTAGYSPTSEMFGGNFAAVGHTIYNPATYDPASGTRQPFPANIIPLSQINPVAKNLLNYYLPGSSLSRIPSNIQRNPTDTVDDDQGGLRVDLALNERHQLFTQLFLQNSPSNRPELYPLSGLSYENGSGLAMLQDVWTFSPRAVNSLRIGFLRANALGGNEAQNLGPILSSIGVSNTFDQRGVTSINLQGYSSFGRSNGEVGNRDNRWQLGEEFTYTSGNHTLALGAEAHYRRGWHLNGNSAAIGRLFFQPTFTAQLTRNPQGQLVPAPSTGDSFADFLLGFPASGSVIGLPVVQYRATQFLPFFQDSWKVTPNLTLNYGISWFVESPPSAQGSARNVVHEFDPSTGLLAYSGLRQISSQPVATDRNNFAPRLGVAWQPRFLKATVIRAGIGTYYSEFPWFLAPYPLLGGSPIGSGINLTNPLANPLPTYALGLNTFPPSPDGVLTDTYAASLPPGTVVTALNPKFRTAYLSQWNLSVQHSISENDSLELDYLGSSGHRLANVLDLSQCRPTADLFCSPAARSWSRYGLILYGDSSGNSSYQALLAKYEHRATYGLSVRFEYALAKALTDTWQSALTIYNQISQCRACSKGPATFDVRHRAVGSLVWNMPFGRGKRFGGNLAGWANAAAGSWTLTAITTFATGQPIQLAAPNQTGSALINPLPNRVCDGRSDNFSDNIRNNGFLWFDTACFTVPRVGYFGNSGPTVLSGPGINNWDIGVEKDFPLARESSRLQFRAEMFNAWNHTQFEPPNGNAGAGANFGRISATRPPRLIQVAVKLLW